eukprot:Awhi_evm1s2393
MTMKVIIQIVVLLCATLQCTALYGCTQFNMEGSCGDSVKNPRSVLLCHAEAAYCSQNGNCKTLSSLKSCTPFNIPKGMVFKYDETSFDTNTKSIANGDVVFSQCVGTLDHKHKCDGIFSDVEMLMSVGSKKDTMSFVLCNGVLACGKNQKELKVRTNPLKRCSFIKLLETQKSMKCFLQPHPRHHQQHAAGIDETDGPQLRRIDSDEKEEEVVEEAVDTEKESSNLDDSFIPESVMNLSTNDQSRLIVICATVLSVGLLLGCAFSFLVYRHFRGKLQNLQKEGDTQMSSPLIKPSKDDSSTAETA